MDNYDISTSHREFFLVLEVQKNGIYGVEYGFGSSNGKHLVLY